MSAEAIVMMLVGLALLYGGLAFCIGIAWFHGRHPLPEDVETPADVPPEDRDTDADGSGAP